MVLLTHTHTHTHTCVCVCTYVCMCVCLYISIFLSIYIFFFFFFFDWRRYQVANPVPNLRVYYIYCFSDRWFCWRRPGRSCSCCVPSSGPCPWTSVRSSACPNTPPTRTTARSRPSRTCAFYRKWWQGSRLSKWTPLNLHVSRPSFCSSQVSCVFVASEITLIIENCNRSWKTGSFKEQWCLCLVLVPFAYDSGGGGGGWEGGGVGQLSSQILES